MSDEAGRSAREQAARLSRTTRLSTRARLTAATAGTAIGGILGAGSHPTLAILTATAGGEPAWTPA
ncbi:hypothetical protein [Kitasatospora sp. NPDC001175]|uniref:hypothetical protein n=1 Tax=Kitasatospora sp. NPDC001175 TaxID=3157103 RepID=UPI003D015ECC